MRKLVSLFLTVAVALLFLAISQSSNLTSAARYSTEGKQQEATDVVDGSVNPELIPEYAAYEHFFRSLTAEENDVIGQRRARAFAEATGLQGADVDALLAAAAEFKQAVDAFDRQVKVIKDQNWPNPSDEVMNQLAELQQQKVTLLTDKATSLNTRLNQEVVKKVADYVNDKVRREIKGSVAPNPNSAAHHSALGSIFATIFLWSPFAPTPPTAYMVNQYTSSSTTYSSYYNEAYGHGQITENYNSYGHTHQVRATITSPDNRTMTNVAGYSSAPVSTTAYISLIVDGIPLEGTYFSTTNGTGYCPVGHVYFTEPNSSSSVLVKVYRHSYKKDPPGSDEWIPYGTNCPGKCSITPRYRNPNHPNVNYIQCYSALNSDGTCGPVTCVDKASSGTCTP